MTSPVLMDTALQQRRRLLANLTGAVGSSNARVLWTPTATEGLTVTDAAVNSRVWTHATAPGPRLRALGKGFALSWNGTTDFMTAPDAADLSFGDGAVDVPFSVFVLANITDTAAVRALFAKQNEYAYSIDNNDKAQMQLVDSSAAAVPSRLQDSATARQGTWALYSMTYSKATGGATAANDITLYENGAVVASTATNAAGYVAMENLTNVPTIGALAGGTSGWASGVLAMVYVVQANALIAAHAAVTQFCRNFYGVPL